MKCVNCNQEIGEDMKFCNFCGAMQPGARLVSQQMRARREAEEERARQEAEAARQEAERARLEAEAVSEPEPEIAQPELELPQPEPEISQPESVPEIPQFEPEQPQLEPELPHTEPELPQFEQEPEPLQSEPELPQFEPEEPQTEPELSQPESELPQFEPEQPQPEPVFAQPDQEPEPAYSQPEPEPEPEQPQSVATEPIPNEEQAYYEEPEPVNETVAISERPRPRMSPPQSFEPPKSKKRFIWLYVLGALVLAGVGYWVATTMISSDRDKQALEQALKLQQAINNNDKEQLTEFAAQDSASAFLPLARILEQEQDYEGACDMAQKALNSSNLTAEQQSEASEMLDRLQDQLPANAGGTDANGSVRRHQENDANSGKTVTEDKNADEHRSHRAERANEETKEEPAQRNRRDDKKEAEPAKAKEPAKEAPAKPSVSDDDAAKNAFSTGDVKTLERLSKKGNKKAKELLNNMYSDN